MPLTKEEKVEHVQKFGKHETDTGSPEVQVALLTARQYALQSDVLPGGGPPVG